MRDIAISKKNTQHSVSVVVPMRNASSTIERCLSSLVSQSYPIKEILVIDNLSKDNSRELVSKFIKRTNVPIRLFAQKKDQGVAASYNYGTRLATSPLVVFMTSDSVLPTSTELGKLVQPLIHDAGVGAAYSTSVLPKFVWDAYNFWEKYFAARMVENYSSLMVLKFDCVRRSAFLEIGGFDVDNFGDEAMGGEDADLSNRLNKNWKIVRSSARSYHLHYLAPDYSLRHMMMSRKMYARSYGRFLRKSPLKDKKATLIFLVKPLLATLPFIPGLTGVGILLLLLYSFIYTRILFMNYKTLVDPRIITIPALNIFFIYYETYWLVQAFFSGKLVYNKTV